MTKIKTYLIIIKLWFFYSLVKEEILNFSAKEQFLSLEMQVSITLNKKRQVKHLLENTLLIRIEFRLEIK